ncbi:MAG: acylphosphatase [Vicinamibacteria bacterium]|nr:acylphosphatase [Vicinamibacteria bacterium]
MTARQFIISGRVQGVGYRFFVVREARMLDVGGYVRNLPDGTVEVVAEGAVDVLRELERRLSQGPSLSHVESVTAATKQPAGIPGFTIR